MKLRSIGYMALFFFLPEAAGQNIGTACTNGGGECGTTLNLECFVSFGLCVCSAGYSNDGSNNCAYDCGALTNPSNGVVQAHFGTTTGDQAKYTCTAGYKVNGSFTRTCQNGTGWDGTEPTCEKGQIGDSCLSDTNLCSLITNGECTSGSCRCVAGYEAENGDIACIEMNECESSPCQNGGTCIDGNKQYTCVCVTGYTDTNCQTDIDNCSPNPCNNGGTCIDGVDSFSCVCLSGFTNATCQAICSVPPDILNGRVNAPTTMFGDTANYTCDPGYEISTGDSSLVCQLEDTWNGTVPTCVKYGNISAEGSTTTISVCYDNNIRPVCNSSHQIAITSAQHGFKDMQLVCPPDETANRTCCIYDNTTDCLMKNQSESRYVEALSGRTSGVISTSNVATTSETACSDFTDPSVFFQLQYQCIPDTRIYRFCTSVIARSELPLYIQNRNYPNGILSTDHSCACSVETVSGSNIEMYTVHKDLYDIPGNCHQNVTVEGVDGKELKAFDCGDGRFNEVVTETLPTNYIFVILQNLETSQNAGNLWLGFRASVEGDEITINCTSISNQPVNYSESMVYVYVGVPVGLVVVVAFVVVLIIIYRRRQIQRNEGTGDGNGVSNANSVTKIDDEIKRLKKEKKVAKAIAVWEKKLKETEKTKIEIEIQLDVLRGKLKGSSPTTRKDGQYEDFNRSVGPDTYYISL